MPRSEFLWSFKLASSWPTLILSFPSAPKTNRSEGPIATPLPEMPSSPSPPVLPTTGHSPTAAHALISPHPLSSQDYPLYQEWANCSTGQTWPVACIYK